MNYKNKKQKTNPESWGNQFTWRSEDWIFQNSMFEAINQVMFVPVEAAHGSGWVFGTAFPRKRRDGPTWCVQVRIAHGHVSPRGWSEQIGCCLAKEELLSPFLSSFNLRPHLLVTVLLDIGQYCDIHFKVFKISITCTIADYPTRYATNDSLKINPAANVT